jgi:hemin uptake protein HemP
VKVNAFKTDDETFSCSSRPFSPAKAKSPQERLCPTTSPKHIDSQQLFAGRRELIIEHQGERYHLRVTRQNKLILTK